jgi:hypothetical protein
MPAHGSYFPYVMTVSADTSFAGLEPLLEKIAGSIDGSYNCTYHYNHVGNGRPSAVIVSVKLDGAGDVSDVKLSSGNGESDEILPCVVSAVKRRHFGSPGANASFMIELTWKPE